MDRRLTTILVADIVGFSRQMAADEEGVVVRLRALRAEVIDPGIAAAGGRLIKTMGDGFLIEFPSAVAAVRAALAIQTDMRERGAAEPEDRRLRLRMGINVGDIVIDGDDILGDGVNIAARLEPLAPAGGVCISRAVFEQVRGKVDVELTAMGAQRLKNIPEPVDIWHIRVDDTASATPLPAADAGAGRPATAERPSVAVLPFDNMSADPEQGYFADGITEDIITELSRLPALLVIARNSTFTYKGKATKVQDVCRDLRVRYVLEGSVRKAGQRVRVTAQLIDGGSGGHVWAERYDRDLADIFAVQDDVTTQIVRALAVQLTEVERGPSSRAVPENLEAYDCVLRAREQYRLFTREGNAAARELYERAMELAPDYAEGYAGAAETHVQDWISGTADRLDNAYALAQTAKRLNPSLPLVYEALSTVHQFMRQHDEALAAARRWVEVEPGDAEAHANLAGVLCFGGEPERVEGLIEDGDAPQPVLPVLLPALCRAGAIRHAPLCRCGAIDQAKRHPQSARTADLSFPCGRLRTAGRGGARARYAGGSAADQSRCFDGSYPKVCGVPARRGHDASGRWPAQGGLRGLSAARRRGQAAPPKASASCAAARTRPCRRCWERSSPSTHKDNQGSAAWRR